MFFIYKSNQIDVLLLKMCHIIKKKPLSCIFKKEVIINDNKILFQYLNIFIANNIGISANFQSIHPNNFIWSIFKKIYPEIKEEKIFKKSIFLWKIMKIIEKNDFLKNISKKDAIIKKFEFSRLVTNLFEKYILYRPNWINQWEKNENNILNFKKNEEWQIKIWKKIKDDDREKNEFNWNFSNLFYKFESLFDLIKKNLPKRLFIICSLSLNPSYMKIFKKISLYTDIHFLYITSYVQENCACDFTRKNFLKNSLKNIWKKYEKYYSLNITKCKKTIIKSYFKKNNIKNLLSDIQNNILFLDNKKENTRKILKERDNSITINVCCNKKQEIEILYKNLLNFLNENTHIQVSDIVVTSFSLEKYITYINSIFKSENKKENIPYYIFEKKNTKTNKILFLLEKILNTSQSRFENKEILELLDITYISEKFDISKDEVNILYSWVKKTNIRWGINIKHKNKFFSTKNNQNTWFYGLNKLLLSYSINKERKVWDNILSMFFIDNSQSGLIGKLCNLINILNKWHKKLSKPKKIKSWKLLFQHFINDFIDENTKIKQRLNIMNESWINMINDILSVNYTKNIPISILYKQFIEYTKFFKNKKFLPGVVNFCHPSLICYIPFKIKCIIGLDHNELPQKKYLNNLDLLNKYPSEGDVDLSHQSCYLFIHNFISCQEYFYISYVGKSIKDNKTIYPSILIDQISNYITSYFSLPKVATLNKKEQLKKLFQFFYKKHPITNLYTIKNIDKKKIIQNKNKIEKLNIKTYNEFFSRTKLIKKSFIIELKKLKNFWKNPIRYFFNEILYIKFENREKNLSTEPFFVNNLHNYQINNIILKKIMQYKDIRDTLHCIKSSGILPHHYFGDIFLEKKIKEIKKIANIIINDKKLNNEKKIFHYKIEKYHITGSLENKKNIGLLRWKTGKIYYCDHISLWIEHLIYCVLGGKEDSLFIGQNQKFSFYALPYSIAYDYLLKYIRGYIQGTKRPLLLTNSGMTWCDKIYDKKNQCIHKDNIFKKKAYEKLYNIWIGNQYIEGEKKNFYIQKITSKIDIKTICKIAQKWFIPILKNIKINNFNKK